jgi:hypothetical protein
MQRTAALSNLPPGCRGHVAPYECRCLWCGATWEVPGFRELGATFPLDEAHPDLKACPECGAEGWDEEPPPSPTAAELDDVMRELRRDAEREAALVEGMDAARRRKPS